MRAVIFLILGLLAMLPSSAAADGRRTGGSTYLFTGRTFSQSPYYYRYTSPYYYRGGFLSPYVHPAPRYDSFRLSPRYNPSYLYDRSGRFDTRRYDSSYLDRFDRHRFDRNYPRFDSGRIDRFHRPAPAAPGARLHVPPARARVAPAPPAGLGDRYHFRGSRSGSASISGSRSSSGNSAGRR